MPGQIDYNALGQAIDTSWGRSSTPLTATTSVKVQLAGEGMLKVNYLSTVSFRSNREHAITKNRESAAATSIVNEVIANVKRTYKELTGKGITINEVSSNDSVEVVGLAVHNPTKRAYYRRTSMFEVA